MNETLDRTDFEILELVQNNADISNKVLANKIGLAPSSCLQRVRRLRTLGVLRGVHADIDPNWLGIGLEAMMAVRLARQSTEAAAQLPAYALSHPEVLSVYFMTGTNDFLIHVAVRDTNHLRALLLEDFLKRDDIAHVETSIIFEHRRSALLPNFALEAMDSTRGRSPRGD